jgi:hypothetical protein
MIPTANTFPDIIWSNDQTYRARFADVSPEVRAFFLTGKGYLDTNTDPYRLIEVLDRLFPDGRPPV